MIVFEVRYIVVGDDMYVSQVSGAFIRKMEQNGISLKVNIVYNES